MLDHMLAKWGKLQHQIAWELLCSVLSSSVHQYSSFRCYWMKKYLPQLTCPWFSFLPLCFQLQIQSQGIGGGCRSIPFGWLVDYRYWKCWGSGGRNRKLSSLLILSVHTLNDGQRRRGWSPYHSGFTLYYWYQSIGTHLTCSFIGAFSR